MEYKRGTVIECTYETTQKGLQEWIIQHATISTEDKEYSIDWQILSNASYQELLGVEDKVSILVDGEIVRNIRIN